MTPEKTLPHLPQGDVLWTADDVATYLQASRSWVYMKAEAGQIPCLRIHGLLRFDPEAIRQFAYGTWKPQPAVLRRNKP